MRSVDAIPATDGRGFMIGGGAGMGKTVGYHVVLSCYGLWLPGDDRGCWSEAWDDMVGFVEPHTPHGGDPVRKRMAAERMKHDPVRLGAAMIAVVGASIGRCAAAASWRVAAASIESTHTHLLLTYTPNDIDNTVKWLKDRTTKSVHRDTDHLGPVWCRGKWRSFVFDGQAWSAARGYIERHNVRRGLVAGPYAFIGA